MPSDSAATTAFCAAMMASPQAMTRSPRPGVTPWGTPGSSSHPHAANRSIHFWKSATNSSTHGARAMNGWSSQVTARRSLRAWSSISMIE